MNKLFVVALLSLILTSGCAKQMDCKAKPDPKVQIDEHSVNIDTGASVSCNF